MNSSGDHTPLQARLWLRALQALALVAIVTAISCGLRQPNTPATAMPPGAPDGLGSGTVVHQEGDATVIMEPERAVQEVMSPQGGGGKCTIDAAKICAAYGQLVPPASDSRSVSEQSAPAASDSISVSAEPVPAAGDSRTVSIQIPGGPAIAVQCRYAGPGGALVSAAAADAPLDGDSRAFLAAHGFCAARTGG